MNKELNNTFVDVRNAFRLLYQYQHRILGIINYIREQAGYTNMWGSKWYSNAIGKRKNSPDSDYANLSVWHTMWGWDFLYGYVFDYYFGIRQIERRDIEMSVLQVSDDGFYISQNDKSSKTNILSYADAEDSHSYLIFNVGCKEWMNYSKKYNDLEQYLYDFLQSASDVDSYIDEKGHFFICKRYPIHQFANQQNAEKIIRDFAKIVFDKTNIKLFKQNFY